MNRIPRDSSSPVLEVKDLTAVLGGQKVLDVDNFKVRSGEVVMVIGPNGCGKTTLLLCLALLYKPDSGSILYNGVSIESRHQIIAQRRRLAVVFQEPLLLNSSVMDNVTIGLKMRGVPKPEIRTRAEKWLTRYGIAHLAKRQARTLSGGEARRTSLARAFALEPDIMFLDEPFIALDSPTRQALLEDFEDVVRETKTTVVMVTHDRQEALVLGDRVAVMINGSIHQCGTPQEVFSMPVDEEVAGFVEAGNIFHGTVIKQDNGLAAIDVNGTLVQVASNAAIGASVTGYTHYDDITITIPGEDLPVTSARNQLRGAISRIFPAGSQIKVFIDCGFMLAALITRRSWEELGLEIGKEVIASFKATSVHLITRHAGSPVYQI